MLLSRIFGRRDLSATRRPLASRRPLLESLEGRQLQTTLALVDLKKSLVVALHIQGQHIGVSEGIQGQHIGMTAGIVGSHGVGNYVSTDLIQGQHIGVTADGIIGRHIG